MAGNLIVMKKTVQTPLTNNNNKIIINSINIRSINVIVIIKYGRHIQVINIQDKLSENFKIGF